jgi:hypothetical protein
MLTARARNSLPGMGRHGEDRQVGEGRRRN